MKVVKVYGALRKKLGQCRFQFDVDTPAQALKALCVNFPGLDKWLIDSEQDGVGYRIAVGKEKLNEQNALLLAAPFSEQEVFSITPIIAGAGGNPGASIGIGVGLIFASFLLPGAGLFGATSLFGATAATAGTAGALTTLGVALSGLGASLVLGGIAQAISPAPVMSSPTNNPMERGRDAAKFESFTFSGIVNTAKQGLPVPIAYGRLFVGSAVLSSGLDVDQIL
jgi:predicted phage tail protein